MRHSIIVHNLSSSKLCIRCINFSSQYLQEREKNKNEIIETNYLSHKKLLEMFQTLLSAPAPVSIMCEFSTCMTRCPNLTRYEPMPIARHVT